MENEALDRINNFLARHGASSDTISKSRMTQLKNVDTAIQVRLAEIQKAKEVLKGRPINVSTIASDTGIARKTFYNNELLRLFVDEYSTLPDDKTVSQDDLERLKGKCDNAEKQIKQFLLRDIEAENLRYENMRLQAEIQNLENRNHSLENLYEEQRLELEELRQKVPKGSNVIQININKMN
jgi:predicted RNase H-like nuclease (RuvC/YqgF family)